MHSPVDLTDTPIKHTLPERQPGTGFRMLDGIRILELSTSIAGPYATMMLGDVGADVIKVERPGAGDDSRAWGPPFADGDSLWYSAVNRNKRSITLDYATPEGHEALAGLIEKSDVVVVNQPLRVQQKLRIDSETCRALRKDIVHVSITGFGLTGARSDWTCYDLIAEGYSGVMDITGDAEGAPQKIGAPAADMLAGADAAFATISALFERMRSGKGHTIDVSLVESMTKFLTCRIVPFLASGELPKRSGGTDSVIAIYQAFETADLPITLGLGNDSIWARFWKAIGQEGIGTEACYATNAQRRNNRVKIVKIIQEILSTKPRAHWLSLFAVTRIPAGPINRIDEVVADEELQARGLFFRLVADGRSIPQVGTGFHIDGKANIPRCAPPRLGASTTEILREVANVGEEKIDALKRAGTI